MSSKPDGSIWERLAAITGAEIPTRFTVATAVHHIRIQAGGDRSAANHDSITLLSQLIDALVEHIGADEPGAPQAPSDAEVTGATLGQPPTALQKATGSGQKRKGVKGRAKPTARRR